MQRKKGTLGYSIRLARWDKDLSQKALAEKVGVTASYLSMLENGKVRTPSENLLRKLATVLNLDFFELLSLSGAPLAPVQNLVLHLREPTLRAAVINMADSSKFLRHNLEGVTLFFAPTTNTPEAAKGEEYHFIQSDGYWTAVRFRPSSSEGIRARQVERLHRRNPEYRPDTYRQGDDYEEPFDENDE